MTNGFTSVTEQYVEDMSFGALIAYCNIYGVDHDEEQWLDDEWHDKESELRVKLMEVLCR